MKRIDMVPKPFFETVGEREITYRIYGHSKGKEPVLLPEVFNSLKETRQFIYKYAHDNPEWLNNNGDINEYNNKPSRRDQDDKWYEGVIEQEYRKYSDFNDWKK
ncbi:hypothetical protein COL41_27780 [Bacillus mycoides]|uniref:hypothetical protein n=1 Tax=Bacillus mycoides TaxID=1405 RepID=UPI000BF33D47|nr:hypothetical protein [Bacillus mycoides]MED1383518.1 hypothetical protein [Bacillus mycoides]PFX90134.1 hypothetical protein COL41_27780 [Bacillus mycoides]QWH79128.1 hypothetical protein EXW59_21530 [Bacillus mycoides]QWI44176.1 hypothetical protein EXW55_14785 [Bacillus mycoides]